MVPAAGILAVLLGLLATWSYRAYRRTRNDHYRLLSLLLWYSETRALIALDRTHDERVNLLIAQVRGAQPERAWN